MIPISHMDPYPMNGRNSPSPPPTFPPPSPPGPNLKFQRQLRLPRFHPWRATGKCRFRTPWGLGDFFHHLRRGFQPLMDGWVWFFVVEVGSWLVFWRFCLTKSQQKQQCKTLREVHRFLVECFENNSILIACFLASNFQSWSNAPNIGSWKYPRKRINIWTKPPVFWVPAPVVELGECSPHWVCRLIRSSASSKNLFLYILDPFRVQIFFRPVLTLCCSSCSFKFEPIRGLRFFPKLRYSSIKNGLIHTKTTESST